MTLVYNAEQTISWNACKLFIISSQCGELRSGNTLTRGLISTLDQVVGLIRHIRCWVLCRDGSCGVLIRHVHGLLQGVLGECWGSAAGSEPPRLHQGSPQSQAGNSNHPPVTVSVNDCDMIGALFG